MPVVPPRHQRRRRHLMPPSVEIEAIDADGDEIVTMGFPPVGAGIWCSHWEPVA